MNFLNKFGFAETRDRRVTAARLQIIGNIDKKLFGSALNEDVDLAVTAEPFARVDGQFEVARGEGNCSDEPVGVQGVEADAHRRHVVNARAFESSLGDLEQREEALDAFDPAAVVGDGEPAFARRDVDGFCAGPHRVLEQLAEHL